jgi:RHH-type proline utilization regulon transcriptional repressor/proline dehydrogenase/delta 1-pyrroline-5-carboxylate dehydrogenase
LGATDEELEARIQELGRELLHRTALHRPRLLERGQDWLLTRAVADARFRARLLRYLDVLAALDWDPSGRAAKQLAREYFSRSFPGVPGVLRAGLRVARSPLLPAPLLQRAARAAAGLLARRFIAPPGEQALRAALAQLRASGRLPSLDLLGEAVLSEREADAYAQAYLDLIGRLALEPDAARETDAGAARLQVSLKLSSLTAHFSPVDPEGSIARVRPRLEAICSRARDAGVGVTLDMEQFDTRDLIWEVFRRVFARGERLGDWPHAGIALQAYLRAAEAHAAAAVEFARARGTPFQVRLVKGAYWDYEVIHALASGWEPPVFTAKADTDAQFERVLAALVLAGPALQVAVASHNARAHAAAQALAAAANRSSRSIEHQTLFRTEEGVSRALASLGWIVRDYVPVGEQLPGMAYLVRRILENSSQVGFLLRSRSGAPPDELLRRPEPGARAAAPLPASPAPGQGAFRRMPAARWFDPRLREQLERALAEQLARSSPPLELADREATARAIERARQGARAWGATPVEQRCAALLHAADRLEARAVEFAAQIIAEGGRDRADAFAEVEEAVDFLRYYATEARALFGEQGARLGPRGVVGVIPPWNFSLSIPAGMTAAALVCGNAAILKPAEQTPAVAWALVELLHAAGVPGDALICLPGLGEVVGAALTEHAGVAMIAFTGSRAVGIRLHAQVAEVEPDDGGWKALVAELGGKNPILVFAEADLDEAVAGALRSAFGHANQKCSAASRVLVQRPVAARFRERLVEAARSLRVGPAEDPATQVNPVIDAQSAARLRRAADVARSEGTVLLDRFEEGGSERELGPLIVELPAGRALQTATFTEELFGPILALVEFESEADGTALADAGRYGLTAGIYSRSPHTVVRTARALGAGNIYVNRPITGARVGIEPFGGLRLSGTGPKAGGPDYLWAFVRRADADTTFDAGEPLPRDVGPAELPAGLAARWDAPLERRLDCVERAAERLARSHVTSAEMLRAAVRAARLELARPQRSVPVPGQRTELWYDTPRGAALLHARSEQAPWWLAAALLAGNPCLIVDSPRLEPVARALRAAGVPEAALQLDASDGEPRRRLLALASGERTDLVVLDSAGALAREVYRRLGPTPASRSSFKALLCAADGPQPGDEGFVRRFAWPRTVAVNTLRHGAELALLAEA